MSTTQWSATINLHTGDYVVPSGVIVNEMRTGNGSGRATLGFSAGSDMGIDLTTYDTKSIPPGLRRVKRVGTAAGLRGSIITLFGQIESA